MNKETRARQLAPIVGRDLRLFRARNPQSFPRTAFISTMRGHLSASESNALFEAYVSDGTILAISARIYRWGNIDLGDGSSRMGHFSDAKVGEILPYVVSCRGKREMSPKLLADLAKAREAKHCPKQEDSPVAPDGMVYMPNGEVRLVFKPISEYSDEELEDELLKRRQLAALKEFMAANSITEDRLLKILGVL